MTVSLNQYRARTGHFHVKALALQRKPFFVDKYTTTQCYILPRFSATKKCTSNTEKSSAATPMQNAHSKSMEKTFILQSGDVHPNPGPTNGQLSIAAINARSIRNKIDLIAPESKQFDVISVCETWLQETDSNDSIQLPNYHPPIRRDRTHQAYGGVAIYVKDYISFTPPPDLQVDDLEAVWVELNLANERILVGSFYMAPGSPVAYWQLIKQSIQKADTTMLKYFILGDLNTDFLTNPSPHLMNIINLYQLHQLTKGPTRITETRSSCLDLIITQSPSFVKSVEILPEICSDHCVPVAVLEHPFHVNPNYKRVIYDYKKLDETKFCNTLSEIDWKAIILDRPLDESTEMFTDTFFEIAKNCMPVHTVTIRPKDIPWINNTLRALIEK